MTSYVYNNNNYEPPPSSQKDGVGSSLLSVFIGVFIKKMQT
jgi:hypothetical protein